MNVEEAYLVMQEASGIQVGDTVKVLRKAKDYEMGWNNRWSDFMVVGQTLKVADISEDGIKLAGNFANIARYRYPFFVLEVVKKAHTITIDGKDIALSEESYKELKKQLCKKHEYSSL